LGYVGAWPKVGTGAGKERTAARYAVVIAIFIPSSGWDLHPRIY
jgi:hypothetical protein